MSEDHLFRDNVGLVWWAVKRTGCPYPMHDDLFQEASIGLLRAIRTFDQARGKFSAHAKLCIQNQIAEHFRFREQRRRDAKLVPTDNVAEMAPAPSPWPAVEARLTVDRILAGPLLTDKQKRAVRDHMHETHGGSKQAHSWIFNRALKRMREAHGR